MRDSRAPWVGRAVGRKDRARGALTPAPDGRDPVPTAPGRRAERAGQGLGGGGGARDLRRSRPRRGAAVRDQPAAGAGQPAAAGAARAAADRGGSLGVLRPDRRGALGRPRRRPIRRRRCTPTSPGCAARWSRGGRPGRRRGAAAHPGRLPAGRLPRRRGRRPVRLARRECRRPARRRRPRGGRGRRRRGARAVARPGPGGRRDREFAVPRGTGSTSTGWSASRTGWPRCWLSADPAFGR